MLSPLPASMDRAIDDRRLTALEVRVYGFLQRDLSRREFREVKLYPLARRFRTSKGSISRMLSHLVTYGYLARGPDGGGPGRVIRAYILTMPSPEGFRTETLPAA